MRSPRTVLPDFTVRFENQYLQLLADQPVRVGPADAVQVERRLDGSLQVRFKQRYLNFKKIAARPGVAPLARKPPKAVKRYRPAPTHPWKQASFARMQLKPEATLASTTSAAISRRAERQEIHSL